MMRKRLKRRLQKTAAALLCLLLLIPAAVPVWADVDLNATFAVDSDYWELWPGSEAISGFTGALMDADTGTILYSKGLDAQRFPASITKVMTALLVLENCALDEQVVMTETGLADAYGGSSNVQPVLGEVFTVEQCLEMLLVKSANDIASQLAEHTAGSVAAFAEMMNARAAELGCRNTHFTNASGLEDDNHYTSARDMALIMQAAIQNSVFRDILMMRSVEIPPTNMSGARYYTSHVYLTDPESSFYYPGCMGGKTGYTPISASTLVCYAQRDGMTLIGVVLGAPETESNARDMTTLFDYGFNNFRHVNVVYDLPTINGGTMSLPYGVEAERLSYQTTDNGDTVDLLFTLGEHRIGVCTMTKDNYDAFRKLRGDLPAEEEAVTAETTETAEAAQTVQTGEEGKVISSEIETTGTVKKTQTDSGTAEREKGGSKPVLYVIIILLGVAILLSLVFITRRNNKIRNQKRKKRN